MKTLFIITTVGIVSVSLLASYRFISNRKKTKQTPLTNKIFLKSSEVNIISLSDTIYYSYDMCIGCPPEATMSPPEFFDTNNIIEHAETRSFDPHQGPPRPGGKNIVLVGFKPTKVGETVLTISEFFGYGENKIPAGTYEYQIKVIDDE